MIFIQNHLGPQQELCCSWMEDIKREQEKGERVYSGALLNCRGLSSTSVGKHARVLLPRPSQFTSLDHFISRHTVTATCNETDNQWQISFTYSFKVGASYNIFVTEQDVSYIIFIHLHLHLHIVDLLQRFEPMMVVEDNHIHIMWLLPQYTIVTIGEILFSITSLEFAYSQGGDLSISSVLNITCIFSLAPPSMKSVLQSLFLMTTAVGNLITMAIIEIFSAFDLPQVFRIKHCNVNV